MDKLTRAVPWKALRGVKESEQHGGVHQSSALSPFLFLLTLHCIVSHLEEGSLRTILYADGDNQEELEEKVHLWQGAFTENGMRLK
ncbi:unnamed protein product [Heligmosomoides polygyrus]|uniref:Reverse transcriptase domain-containing protein n=1 Tax=Heligmosomoides polygyrus TaxID=6339 RepID=A0A183GSC9_HELPZ|nr:unnamed protein product [Heligmosomoides polygyrus]